MFVSGISTNVAPAACAMADSAGGATAGPADMNFSTSEALITPSGDDV